MITKDMTIFDAISKNPDAADVLLSLGMKCLGCAIAHGETIEQAAQVHGIELDFLLDKLNQESK